jgi:amylovoran biosynthesis glycosyltransferase AmsD
MDKNKGIDYLIRIMRLYCRKNGGWNFRVIGRGKLAGYLLRAIAKWKLTGRVEYVPLSNQIGAELSGASCLLMTSRHEGLPMVMIESITCGVPVIAFDINTGPSEIIEDNLCGYMVKKGDVDQFVDKMITFSENEDIRTSFSERAKVRSVLFAKDNILNKWNDYLHYIVNGG